LEPKKGQDVLPLPCVRLPFPQLSNPQRSHYTEYDTTTPEVTVTDRCICEVISGRLLKNA